MQAMQTGCANADTKRSIMNGTARMTVVRKPFHMHAQMDMLLSADIDSCPQYGAFTLLGKSMKQIQYRSPELQAMTCAESSKSKCTVVLALMSTMSPYKQACCNHTACSRAQCHGQLKQCAQYEALSATRSTSARVSAATMALDRQS